jgi:predicted dehydrogenase
MTGDRIRWGILATGTIARNFAADLRLMPDAQLAAVGSRSLEAAQAFAADFGVPRAYGSWQALAEDPEVDVVYVATPHSAHHAATMTCLRARNRRSPRSRSRSTWQRPRSWWRPRGPPVSS